METNANCETPDFTSAELNTDFRLSERKHRYEETDIGTTYGITATFTDLSGNFFKKSIDDISVAKETVEKIIDFLKREKVSFFHFESVIEDILFEQNIV